MSRLRFIAPHLVERLTQLTDSKRRQIAQRAARLAIARAGLDHALLNATQEAVHRLVEKLDEQYFHLYEAWDAGEVAEEDDWKRVFSQARAAAAAEFLFEHDSLLSACECIYEAHAATDDLDAIEALFDSPD